MKVFKFLLVLAGAGVAISETQAADTGGFQPPVMVMAGSEPMDTTAAGGLGHAAPFMIDLDGDGKRDLVVGSIGGRFYFYKNTGTDAAPLFAEKTLPLMLGNRPLKVVNWCCMAVAPQFADIDGDGVADLTAGSYGGPVYWHKGLGGLQFDHQAQLLTWRGMTLVAHPETFNDQRPLGGNTDTGGPLDSYAANAAWTLWNDAGQLDLLLGNQHGELFVWAASQDNDGFAPSGLPVFRQAHLVKEREIPMEILETTGVKAGDLKPLNEILINGEKVLPGDHHAAPAVADWDGDGLWDIILGSMSGNVYWLRNTGKPGAPAFKTREKLLDAGAGYQWVEPGKPPGRGVRTQVHVVDYNLDGKMDLLVGDWAAVQEPRADLSKKERKEMLALKAELAALDRKVGFDDPNIWYRQGYYTDPRNPTAVQHGGKKLYERVMVIEKQLAQYLVKHQSGDQMTTVRYTGHVWLYLRN